jgi:hypothetical protein
LQAFVADALVASRVSSQLLLLTLWTSNFCTLSINLSLFGLVAVAVSLNLQPYRDALRLVKIWANTSTLE